MARPAASGHPKAVPNQKRSLSAPGSCWMAPWPAAVREAKAEAARAGSTPAVAVPAQAPLQSRAGSAAGQAPRSVWRARARLVAQAPGPRELPAPQVPAQAVAGQAQVVAAPVAPERVLVVAAQGEVVRPEQEEPERAAMVRAETAPYRAPARRRVELAGSVITAPVPRRVRAPKHAPAAAAQTPSRRGTATRHPAPVRFRVTRG